MGSPLQFVVHSGSSGYLISNIAVSRNSGSRHTVQAKLQTLITLSSSLSLMCTRTRSFSLCAAWSRSTRYFTASIILRTVSASNTQVLCTARTVQFMEPRTGLFCLMQLPLSRLLFHRQPQTLPSRLQSRPLSHRPLQTLPSRLRCRRPPRTLHSRLRCHQPTRILPSRLRCPRPPRTLPSRLRCRRPSRTLHSRLRYHQLPRTLPSRLRYPRPPRTLPSRLRCPLRHRTQRNHPRARRPLQFQLGARRRRQPVPTLRRI